MATNGEFSLADALATRDMARKNLEDQVGKRRKSLQDMYAQTVAEQEKAKTTEELDWMDEATKGASMGSIAGPWGALAGGILGTLAGQWQAMGHRLNNGESGGKAFLKTQLSGIGDSFKSRNMAQGMNAFTRTGGAKELAETFGSADNAPISDYMTLAQQGTYVPSAQASAAGQQAYEDDKATAENADWGEYGGEAESWKGKTLEDLYKK